MWDFCGVVRQEAKLDEGLRQIEVLKSKIAHLDVRPDSEGFEDLMLAFDLEAAIMSAEATIIGAKARKESRGAHQRSDFTKREEKHDVNYAIQLTESAQLTVRSEPLSTMTQDLQKIIESTKEIRDFKGMLLE